MTALEPAILFGFVLASAVIIIVPGPTVTVIIANSIRHGARAGLLNVVGTQLGMAMMVLIVAYGLDVITTSLAFVFDWLRLIGAAYLIWLGWKLLRSDGSLGASSDQSSKRSFFWQGFFVIWSNPKALLFIGAFIPQFVSQTGDPFAETLLLGFIFMIVGTVFDGAYAIAAGKAGGVLTRRNIRTTEVVGGSLLIAGGAWLALDRS